MKIFKKIAVRVIPAGVLAFLVFAAIAYQRGVYDITFIERPTTDTTADTTAPADTEPVDTAEPVVTDQADTTENPQPVETNVPVAIDPVDEFLSTLRTTSDMTASGYTVTDAEYARSTTKLTLLNASITLPSAYTYRQKTVEVPERIPDEYSGYTTNLVETAVDRPAVEIYMDYLVVDNGSGYTLLKNDGSVLAPNFDLATYEPAYTRDKNDLAVFVQTIPPKTLKAGETYKYYTFNDAGELVESDYNDAADNRGLYINYPSYFGKTDNDNYHRYYSNGYYGYGYANGTMRSYFKYAKAYNYSEGIAVVCDENGIMSFLNQNFYPTLSRQYFYQKAAYGRTDQYFNLSNRRIYAHYRAPDTNGIESLGFYYFDHGLIRVRRWEYDAFHYEYYNGKTETLLDTDTIIRSDGTEFPIPSGYTVKAYSNGVMLLEKDGLYGFLDYTGKWIAQPIYTYAEPFNEGLAVIGDTNGKKGVIDTSGEFVIPQLFDEIGSASGGLITAYNEGSGWTLFNKVQ
ncbi:MAG: WG repeat-containing protein [Clostridia bacterium]|nr:WG repeat-containing protein [Clostridia bacterium]